MQHKTVEPLLTVVGFGQMEAIKQARPDSKATQKPYIPQGETRTSSSISPSPNSSPGEASGKLIPCKATLRLKALPHSEGTEGPRQL
jgi:hypothetical protein